MRMPEGRRDGYAVGAPIEDVVLLSPGEPNDAMFSDVSRCARFRPRLCENAPRRLNFSQAIGGVLDESFRDR